MAPGGGAMKEEFDRGLCIMLTLCVGVRVGLFDPLFYTKNLRKGYIPSPHTRYQMPDAR
jgi:hypothetical protein